MLELIIVVVAIAGFALWFFNRDKGFDVNKDGKVDVEDAKAAVDNAVDGTKAAVDTAVKEVKEEVAKAKATVKKKTSAKKAQTKK